MRHTRISVLWMQELRSCNPSLASLEDISPAKIFCGDFNFIVFFLLSIVVNYCLNETYISSFQSFQILFFSVSFFSCVLLSLSSTFYLSPVFLCISSNFSFFFSLFLYLPSTFFLAAFYLSPLTFFVYHLIFLSASISFFVFYFPSWLSSTFILCLSYIIFPLLLSLSFCAFAFFIIKLQDQPFK